TSQEKIFYNMTTPIINLSLPTQLASSQVSFTATYSQAENIQLKSWQAALYPVSYRLDGGHIIERADGSVLDSGHITDLINKSVEKRYSLDEGHINDLIEKIKKSGEEG
ncbi:hypothetical protein NVV37_24475, partial [Escherichia coli]|nr:hypothetical protein [Escherichia coli]